MSLRGILEHGSGIMGRSQFALHSQLPSFILLRSSTSAHERKSHQSCHCLDTGTTSSLFPVCQVCADYFDIIRYTLTNLSFVGISSYNVFSSDHRRLPRVMALCLKSRLVAHIGFLQNGRLFDASCVLDYKSNFSRKPS